MAPLFTSTSLQRRELLPLPPCNYFSPSTPPAFNFCSSIHTFLPNTIHFSANLSPNSRAKSINFKLYEKLDSGFCSSKCNFGWVVSSFGDCNSLLLLEESVVLGFVKNGVCSYGCKNVADSVREGFKNKGKNGNFWNRSRKGSGFCSSRCNGKWVGTKMVESVGNGFISKGQSWDFEKSTRMDPGFRSVRHGDDGSYARVSSYACNGSVKEKIENEYVNGNNASNGVKVKTMGKGSKKSKADSEDFKLRVELDMCSKKGDVMGAICLYDSATREGIRIGQYHYTVLLYLCSSAAMGVIRPAKSGSGTRSLDMIPANDVGELCSNGYSLDLPKQDVESTCGSDNFVNESTDFLTKLVPQKYNSASVSANGDDEEEGEEEEEEESDTKDRQIKQEQEETQVSEDVKRYALERGFEIYKMMCSEKIRMNEAALTSVARMAMAMGNGDMAFDMVKQMKALGINPKLRSYGPALSAFCISGEIDKAFAVEKHMLEHGVHPEEPELEALLRVSVETGKADKVYYLLHKLRTCVRSVSQSTADLIEKWFKSKEAYRVGKMKWDRKMIARVMENVGGGWHGQGWLGRGKWRVLRSSVDADGFCKCCGEKLALIDLDPEDTDRFAESVASIAIKREKNSSFQKFQRWLNYYGPFEAVVDAANVGLYSQKRFKPSKVNAVVNGIRQKLPSRKWPLIVLHNKRLTGSKMDQPVNKGYVERWRNADALYATPTGSNDDWYWLYAAIKFKCLIVTNDEMRDHTFQLLGNDFFPKWKERHQVRFSFSEVGPIFHMPPPCSVVIQESEKGEWHIPVESHHQSEEDRTWLCITRAKSQGNKDPSKVQLKDQKENPKSDSQHSSPVIAFRNLRNILSESVSSDPRSVLVDIEAAEERGGCVIDFQI